MRQLFGIVQDYRAAVGAAIYLVPFGNLLRQRRIIRQNGQGREFIVIIHGLQLRKVDGALAAQFRKDKKRAAGNPLSADGSEVLSFSPKQRTQVT